jgi:prepilin-type N-terminal cleavage/methylation domain-containing protein/prepilin-type processing-associated H-X9-DG protein
MSLSSKKRGFTLVELLVVIGIIAVLMGILMPALTEARKQAQSIQCLSNLRTVGQGLKIYMLQNRGSLPWGDFLDPINTWNVNSETANWSIRVASALQAGKLGENFATSTTSKGYLRCPSATSAEDTSDQWVLHYTCNPRLMPGFSTGKDSATGKRQLPYRDGQVKNSSEIVIIFDGAQYLGASGLWEGNAHPLGSGLDNWRCGVPPAAPGVGGTWGHAMLNPSPVNWDMNLDAPTDMGSGNTDCVGWSGNQQNIRFRHSKNNRANVLYVDGHAASLNYRRANEHDLKRRNVCVNWPN